MDNLSTHSGNDVNAWLAKHPHVRQHYTPTGSSWLNVIETWPGIITRQAIRRGTFTVVSRLRSGLLACRTMLQRATGRRWR
jgi:hypothetical protein